MHPDFFTADPPQAESAPTPRSSLRIFMLPTSSVLPLSTPDCEHPHGDYRDGYPDELIVRLADSIRRHGMLQPLTVRRPPDDGPWNGTPRYELISGRRRLRAAQLLGLSEVPCIIVAADDLTTAEIAIIENLQREKLNIFEEASALRSLIDIYGVTQEQLAERLSLSQSYISNKLRLLRLTEKQRSLLLDGGLSERHARAFLRISDPDERTLAICAALARGMNVAATERYVDQLLHKVKDGAPSDSASGSAAEKEFGVTADTDCAAKASASIAASAAAVSDSASDTSAAAALPAPTRTPRDSRAVVKDVRIFVNTIERAVESIRRCGVPVTIEQDGGGAVTEIRIRIGS